MLTDNDPKHRNRFRMSPEGYAVSFGVLWAAFVLKLTLMVSEIGSEEFLRRLLLITVVLVGTLAIVIVIDALCHRERPRWPFVRRQRPGQISTHPNFELVWDFFRKKITVQELLRQHGETDGARFADVMIRDAAARRDADDFEAALGLFFRLGTTAAAPKDLLCALADAEWHHSHEDVISYLDRLRDSTLIPILVRATQWLPEYMAWDDENRTLARKAIYAISKIDDPKADEALSGLAQSEHPGIRALAERKLRERAERAKLPRD
jgi:hypothetical protein